MIARLVLTLSLLFLLPASVLAKSPTLPDNCVDKGTGIIVCQMQSTATLPVTSDSSNDLAFTIESLANSEGLGVIIRDGSFVINNDFLSATIGCNAFSAPVSVAPDGLISVLASPASTAMFCPQLDTEESLLSAILLGRDLTIDLAAQTVRSENGVIELAPIDSVQAPAPIAVRPALPADGGIAGMGGVMGAAASDEMRHHCMHDQRCHSGFLASLATALIAFLLFGLGFFLGLQVDRRGGLMSPARPTTPSTPGAATTPVVRLAGEKQRNVAVKGRNANAAKKEKTYRV